MNTESITRYRDDFAQLESQLPGANLPWLQQARRGALDRFSEAGFPTTAREDWKYTNVGMIGKRAFKSAPQSANGVSAREVDDIVSGEDHVLVFINGRYTPALSRLVSLPQGATVLNLAAALGGHSDSLEALLDDDSQENDNDNGFTALNAAMWTDGAYIDLGPGIMLEQPIHLLFIGTEADLAIHPRNIIHASAGAGATIVEHYIGSGHNADNAYFTNATTRIVADSRAAIEHYKVQQESGRAFHIASIDTQQAQDSRFTSHSFALGALLSRNDIGTRFNAEGCTAVLNGLYMANGRRHVDHHTSIDHAQPRGTSRELYKGVLDGAARAVFNGKVIVRPNAQKTDARQSNRNLLLSENAEIDTKPQLEIYADDVKCSHGATVGQLDENQLFYLRCRGLPETAARNLLTYAFAEEIIGQVGIAPLRARLERLLIDRLPERLTDIPAAPAVPVAPVTPVVSLSGSHHE
jgi:Fe-S cluster assembly protein SufD